MLPCLLDVTVPGLPVSLNNMYRNTSRGRALTDKAKARKQEIILHIKSKINYAGIDYNAYVKSPLRIRMFFFVPALYRSDWDGLVKMAQDAAMQAMGLDDRYIVSALVTKTLDKDNPRFRITIWQLD